MLRPPYPQPPLTQPWGRFALPTPLATFSTGRQKAAHRLHRHAPLKGYTPANEGGWSTDNRITD